MTHDDPGDRASMMRAMARFFAQRFHPATTAWIVLSVAYGISMTIAPLFYHDLGLARDAIGWLAGVQGAGIIAGAWLARRMSDDLGPRTSFIAATTAYAVLVTVFGQLESFWTLAGARFLDGVVSVIAMVAIEVAIGRATRHRAARLGGMVALGAIGFCLGTVSANIGFEYTSLPWLFAAAGGVALVSVASAIPCMPTNRTSTPATPDDAREDGAGGRQVLLTRGWHGVVAALGWGAFHATWVVLMPLAAMELFSLSEAKVLWLAPLHIAGVIILTPALTHRLSGERGLALATGLSALGCALIAAGVQTWFLWAVIFAVGGTSSAAQVRALAVLMEDAPVGQESVANEVNAIAGAVGKIVGPIALGVVFHRLGPTALVCALTIVWGLLTMFVLGRYATRHAHR